MAIRDDNRPPATPGSITKTADAQQERINNISNVSKTVSNMQKDVKQRVTEAKGTVKDSEAISSVQGSMNKVLEKLGGTIDALSKGVKTITVDTAAATKDAIGQYGKAISEDISFNKQNIVAMALARSTPIYGYFIAKFMETDVWKGAVERMKASIGRVFGSVAGLFRRGPKEAAPGRGRVPGGGRIPSMQHGGYVEKGGFAKVHAAEVVMPIEKVLSRIDDTISVTKNMAKIVAKQQLQAATTARSLRRMVLSEEERIELMTGEKKKRPGIIRDFLKIVREEKMRKAESLAAQQLRALLAIQDSLGAKLDTWPQIWNRLLLRHPAFRSLVLAGRTVINLAGLISWKPIYALFKTRGGYRRYLSRSTQPLTAVSQNIGLTYVESMWRFDNMLNLLKAIAEATRDMSGHITGKKYRRLKGIGTGEWSLAGGVTRGLGIVAGGALMGLGALTGLIPGETGMGFRRPGRALLRAATRGRYAREYELGETAEGIRGSLGSEQAPMYVQDVTLLQIQEKFQRVYETIADRLPKQKKQMKVITESSREQISMLGKLKRTLKGNRWLTYLGIAWTFISKWVKLLWMGTIGKLFKWKFLKSGLMRMLGWMGISVGAGAGGGIIAALGTAIGMGIWDAWKVAKEKKAEKWGVSKPAATIGGILGGTIEGLKGAAWGAAKYGALGAGVGLFAGPLGAAIGGALGVIVGGIYGYVGGKKIAQNWDFLVKEIKKFVSAAKDIFMHPFESLIRAKDWFLEQLTWKKLTKHAMFNINLVWSLFTMMYDAAWNVFKHFAPDMAAKAEAAYEWAKETAMIPLNWASDTWDKIKKSYEEGTIVIDTIHAYLSFISWPHRMIGKMAISLYDWFVKKFGLQEHIDTITDFVKWPFRKIREMSIGVYDWFFEKFNLQEHKENITAFISWPFRKIGELVYDIKAWFAKTFSYENAKSQVTSFVTWPFRKIKEMSTSIYDWFFKKFNLQEHKESITSFISWPFHRIGEIAYDIKDWINEAFNIEEHKKNITSFVTWPFRKVEDIATSIKEWAAPKFEFSAIMETLRKPIDGLLGIFTWIGDLFTNIKDSIVSGITKIPGAKWFLGEDKPPEKPRPPKKSTIIGKAVEARKLKLTFEEAKAMAAKAEAARKEAAARKKVEVTGESFYNKLEPKSREIFQTAKRFYIKQFGWSEEQADQALIGMASAVGNRLDLLMNPKMLKLAGIGLKAEVKDIAGGAIDKTKLIAGKVLSEIGSGELVKEGLGKIIEKTAKETIELSKEASAVGTALIATTNNNIQQYMQTSSNVSTRGSRGPSEYVRYTFNDTVLRGESH